MRLPPTALLAAALLVTALPTQADSHFESCAARTGNNATLIVPASSVNVNGEALDAQDELALFTPTGACAGRLVWDGQNAAVAIWEDDPMTEATEGFAEGDTMMYVIWDASEGLEYGRDLGVVTVSYDEEFEGTGIFVPDAIYQASEIAVIVSVDGGATPAAFALAGNYPNPFSRQTTIPYELAETGRVKLEVFDTLGRRVSVLVDDMLPAGRYEADFEADNELASGVYLYRLQAAGLASHRRMTIVN
jgi:hypothetical protein